jgi:hypothetical protein
MGTRIGQFFFLVGLLVMFVFSASFMNETPDFKIFLIGLGSILLGMYIMIRNRVRSSESERFRRIRKMRAKKKD